MKKKTIANIGMCVVIFIIILLGVFSVGHIKGWFDKQDNNIAFLTDVRGIIVLERDGIAYVVKEDAYLRSGDVINCESGATVKIALGEDYISLGSNVKAKVQDIAVSTFQMDVEQGEVFVNTDKKLILSFGGRETAFENTVASLSVRSGTQSISVFAGTVEGAECGQSIEWIGSEVSVKNCSIQSLNSFHIAELRKANEQKTLVFSNADLDKLESDRWNEIASIMQSNVEAETEDTNIAEKDEDLQNSETPSSDDNPSDNEKPVDDKKPTDEGKPTDDKKPTDEGKPTDDKKPTDEGKPTDDKKPTDEGKPTDDKKPTDEDKPTDDKKPTDEDKPTDDKKPTDENKPTDDEPVTESEKNKLSCTITIRCDTILNNWDNLDPAKAPYVPNNGCILPAMSVEFTEGETVFDVLNRVCEIYDIQIEYSWTPMYDSYYIEGIHNLYEFDCGSESGWMYKVNGWFPNYGCSGYVLTGGETIVWCYTCNGLGADVGAEGW